MLSEIRIQAAKSIDLSWVTMIIAGGEQSYLEGYALLCWLVLPCGVPCK